MRCLRCGVCCTKTQMLLSKEDLKHLEKKGYSKKSFSYSDKAGYVKLRNRGGYCVFYDAEGRRCKIYPDRPSGCRVYPVILDEATGIITDSICSAKASVTKQEKAKKGKKVLKLLEKIDAEAQGRRKII